MAWPGADDYMAAVQNPSSCFNDPQLKMGQAAPGAMPGLPLSSPGRLVQVHKLDSPEDQCWAVKCFTRRVDDLQQRYFLISRHLGKKPPRFTVEFHYLEDGIWIEDN